MLCAKIGLWKEAFGVLGDFWKHQKGTLQYLFNAVTISIYHIHAKKNYDYEEKGKQLEEKKQSD